MPGAAKPPDYLEIARFRGALREYESTAETAARAAGLTLQRYLLLLMVRGAPSGDERATVNEIAERLKVAPHSITGAVARAERAGLVRRRPSTEDRRRTWVTLTAEGERRLERVVTALERQRDSLLATIDAAARDAHAIADARRASGPRRRRSSPRAPR